MEYIDNGNVREAASLLKIKGRGKASISDLYYMVEQVLLERPDMVDLVKRLYGNYEDIELNLLLNKYFTYYDTLYLSKEVVKNKLKVYRIGNFTDPILARENIGSNILTNSYLADIRRDDEGYFFILRGKMYRMCQS